MSTRGRSKAEAVRSYFEAEKVEGDFMLGARKLRDLGDAEVLAWSARCSARAFLLDLLIKVLSSETPAESLLADMFQES